MTNEDSLAGHLSELFGDVVSVETVFERDQPEAKLTVCRMSYDSFDTHTRRRLNQVVQSAVVLDADQLNLPQFALAPEMEGVFGKILAGLGGFGDIDFEDSPEFSESYHLHGWNEEPVRVLFTKSVRDYFASEPDWSVRGDGSRLVIFRFNKVCQQDAMESFVQKSLKILSLFREGEQQLDARPQLRRETRPEDMAATAARMGGIVGGAIRKQLRKVAVTRDELESFLQESPPRNIPPGLKRQVLGDNFVLIFVGAIFLAAGVIAGPLVLTLGQGNVRWIGLPLAIFQSIVGGLMMGLTIRHRGRKARVLREGTLADGTVTGVSRSGMMVNNQVRYHVTVAYSVDGQERTTTCNAYGLAAEQARTRAASGETACVLVDPADLNHVVCADLVTTFE